MQFYKIVNSCDLYLKLLDSKFSNSSDPRHSNPYPT